MLESGIEERTGLRGVVAGGGGVDVEVTAGGKLVVDSGSLEDGGGAPSVTLHDFTIWTRGSPFGPVTGVNVKVHVSVTGPASV